MVHGKLHIGWAKGDITPTRKTLIQGQFHGRISAEVVSPLSATAMALEVRDENGATEQAVFLTCDLAADGFTQDLLRELTARDGDFDPSKLTVTATHTHNAPCVKSGFYEEPENDPDFLKPDEYRAFLVAKLADIVTRAWEGRQPGNLSRGFGYAVVGRCRRAVYADGSTEMYGSTNRRDFIGLEACDDHAVNMLFTRNPAGDLTGIVVNLACPSQCDENGEFISADFWHEVREGLAARYGVDVHLLSQCAPAGDLSPHLMTDQKEEANLRGRLGLNDKSIIARRILAAVEEGLATASASEDTMEFAHDVKTLRLPRMMVTDEEYRLEKQIPHLTPAELAQQSYAFQRIWPFGPVCDIVTRYERQSVETEHQIRYHVIRLGDIVFASNPFELFVDFGMTIRSRSRAVQTFLIQLADGSNDGFYLPTQRALDGGHYSAMIKSNWVGPEGGWMLVDETVASINSLFEGAEYPRAR